MTDQQSAVDIWNSRYPIGTPVTAYPGARPQDDPNGERLNTRTRSEAQVLSGHTAVVWVDGHSACIALAHVDPVQSADAYTPPAKYVRSDGADCCPHAVRVGPGSCEACWDLVKWDAVSEEPAAVQPPAVDRATVSATLWAAAEHHTVAEWICCDPIDPAHALCVQGGAALRMLKALLVDDPDAWKPAPLLDEVMRLAPPAADRGAVLAECDAIEADYRDQHDDVAVGARAAVIRIRARAVLPASPDQAAADAVQYWFDAASERRTERDRLRAEVAELRAELDHWRPDGKDGYGTPVHWTVYNDMHKRAADAEAQVARLRADRAAVLREAIDVAREEGHRLEEVAGVERARGARSVAYLLRKLLVKAQPAELRRMADEEQPACPGHETAPNRCGCGCEGCKHNCAAHQSVADEEQPEAQAEPQPAAYVDSDGRTFCLACPRPSNPVPLTAADVEPWDLCPSCGRHVAEVAQPATAEPTPLRWGFNDTLWGDDDTVTVMLSGPAGEPYWLELDPERAAVLRQDLAGPGGAEQPETQATGWRLTPETLDLFVRALINHVDYDIHKGYECGEEDGADHYPELVAEAAERLDAITGRAASAEAQQDGATS